MEKFSKRLFGWRKDWKKKERKKTKEKPAFKRIFLIVLT
jgi:hypothetical protein